MKIKWEEFAKILECEFIKNSNVVTEDTIRYLFIDGVKLAVDNLQIEKPYTDFTGLFKSSYPTVKPTKKNPLHLDLYFEENKTKYFFEFKYDKGSKYTEFAGSAFNDLNRLSTINAGEKYFVYLVDLKLYDYYEHKLNGCFYGKTSKIKFNIDKTFKFNAKGTFPNNFIKYAFKSFVGNHADFSSFSYKIERVVVKEIVKDNIYFLIYKVS